tara:strand:- start:2280 stop:2561 length:282 start_codon:yes stop_codon:yes gene_type:complete
MTDNKITIPEEIILTKIYFIRKQKVMIDRDLAELYGVETRRLNEQVKRNLSRFPEDFMFQLSEPEFTNLNRKLRHQVGVDEESCLLYLLNMVY